MSSAVLAVLVVTLLLALSVLERLRRRAVRHARLYAELASRQEQENGRSREASVAVLVAAAGNVLGQGREAPAAGDTELVVLVTGGALAWESDGKGGTRRRPLRPAEPDPPWLLRAVGETGAVAGVEEGRPWLSTVVGAPTAPLAVLHVRRPAGASPFRRADLRLADLLAAEGASWLAGTTPTAFDRSLGVPGQFPHALDRVDAATAPALVLLRESADRLARLAESPSGVEQIVEELHHVETAVASVLGAVALAAEPDLLHLPEPEQQRGLEDSSDWTTTGVLR